MVVLLVLGALLLIAFGAQWVLDAPFRRGGFRPFARRPRHREDRPTSPPASRWLQGGGKIGPWQLPEPLVMLSADATWVCLHGRGFPTVWIARSATTEVRTLGSKAGVGVLFASADGRYDKVLFLALDGPEVRRVLGQLGWPIAEHRWGDRSRVPPPTWPPG